ncbi:MAG TPA: glycosyltransferase family 1 protein, partial [Chloroflexota bacterium]
MRIAIDYTAAINQQAGIGRFTRNLVKALAALDSENQYVLLCARPNPGVQPTYPQAPNFVRRHLRVSERTMTILWHRMRLPIHAEWLTGPVDIFHSPDFVLPYLGSSRGVVTIHDLAFILYPECAEPSLREYLDRVVPHAAARATFVVADSEHTRNDTICLLDVPPERVAVVPGGVEDHFQPVTDPERLARARQLVGTEAPFILYVGTIEPRKNLERLIAAYDLLKARYQLPHKLVLAGKRGWLWEGIVRRAEQSPYRDDLLWPGFIPEELLPALY